MCLPKVIPILLALAALAEGHTLSFDGFPDSTILSNQLPGLTFSNTVILTSGITLNEFEFPPRSGANVVSDNGGPIALIFQTPVFFFEGYFTYAVPLTLEAFDLFDNHVITAISAFQNNQKLSGDFGSTPNELIQLSSLIGFSKLTITGDPAGASYSMDDVTLSSVPEPSSALFVIAALALVWCKFAGKKPNQSSFGGAVVAISLVAFCASSSAAAPAIGTVTAKPGVLPANTSAQVTITAQIEDASTIPTSVNLLLIGHPGPTVLGRLHDDGTNGDAVAGDHVYTIVQPFSLATGQAQLQISVAFRGMLRRVVSPPVPLLFLTIPAAFAVNPRPLAVGGPLSLNTFQSVYQQGGVIPAGGAQIDIVGALLPEPPLSSYVARELEGSTDVSTSTQIVSGVSCIRASFTDAYTPVLNYKTSAVYCPSGNVLYKFHLSYHAGDSNESYFLSNFQQVLNNAKFSL